MRLVVGLWLRLQLLWLMQLLPISRGLVVDPGPHALHAFILTVH